MNQILLAFLTGITTGGISCFAVQGGLLTGVLSEQKSEDRKKTLVLFLLSKFVSHVILGGLLGLLGSVLIISLNFQGVMQIISGLIIILMALKISEAHPIFKRFSITPPKFLFRFVRNESKVKNSFAPIIIGLLTTLIPCGVTQSIMILSVSSSSFLYGAAILGAFILGTTPIFFALGIASDKILAVKQLKNFAVLIMFYLGLSSINSGQILRGSLHTWQNYKSVLIKNSDNVGNNDINIVNGKQQVTINVTNGGYKSDTKKLKVGTPVKLSIVTKNVQSCARSFVIPSMDINKLLPVSGVEVIEFTPEKAGLLAFSCSMGMYTGSFEVVD